MSSGSNYETLAILPLFKYQVFGSIEVKYNYSLQQTKNV